jgi:hypothetical protein
MQFMIIISYTTIPLNYFWWWIQRMWADRAKQGKITDILTRRSRAPQRVLTTPIMELLELAI